jgi:hypothetical protein
MIELASLLIVNLLPSILDISKFSFSLFSHLSNRFSKAIGPETKETQTEKAFWEMYHVLSLFFF